MLSTLEMAMSEGERVQGLFLDLNSYFASVEQEVQPELRQQPVAVVPMLADTTCCIAASYEAKAYGIRTGTGVKRMPSRCAPRSGWSRPVTSSTCNTTTELWKR